MQAVLIVFLLRALAWTLRWRVEDRCGLTNIAVCRPFIGLFWHNRMLVIPYFYRYYCTPRRAVCLTSPSKDGAIIAKVMARFRIGNVRGSSSRRGVEAMRELVDALNSGFDVAITPDGPRGPKYRLHPGALKLAQLSGVPITLVHVVYSSYWELKSWDGFRIPKPFSRVTIICDEPVEIPRELDEEALEALRAKLEGLMAT